jgi:hypothetical protein
LGSLRKTEISTVGPALIQQLLGSLGGSVSQQKFDKLVGMIDHKVVSGTIDGPDFPAFGFRPFVTDPEIWVAFCRKHIGNILDVFKIACELDAFL